MEISLAGIHVLITGASRGIGAAAAEALAASGAKIAAHYFRNGENAERIARKGAPGSVALGADLSDAKACENLFSMAADKLGGIDVVLNNAGVALRTDPAGESPDWLAAWERTLAVNLTAPALLSRLAVEHFANRGGGRLIQIASRAAFRGDTKEYLAYAASKGGLVALSRSIARAYGKQNIQSFVIAPGFVRTDMAQDFIEEYGEDYATKDLALSKLTEPQDLAPMIVLLASGHANHATGCTIDINAGSYVH